MSAQALISNPFLNWDHNDGDDRTPAEDFSMNVRGRISQSGIEASVQFTKDGTTVWMNIHRLGEEILTTRFIPEAYLSKRRYCLDTSVLRACNINVFTIEDAVDTVFPL